LKAVTYAFPPGYRENAEEEEEELAFEVSSFWHGSFLIDNCG
jgi:hypothetical protein